MPAFVFVDADNSLVVQDCYEERTAIADLGGCWDAVNKVWRIVFTVANLESLLDRVPNIVVDVNLTQRVKDQMEKEDKLEKLRTMSKQDMPVCLRIPGLKGSLYNYQKLGIMYAVTNGVGLLLADHPGLGKSLQAIGTALVLKERGAKRVLIAVPASLKFNWPLEIEKFTEEKYVVIDGTPSERIVQWLRDDVFFYIANYELIIEDLFGGRKFKEREDETDEQRERRENITVKAKQRQGILASVRNRNWDMVCIDESQALCRHASRRSRDLKSLRAKYKMALTGTPMDGRLEELYSIMQFVAPGLLLSKTRFFQKHIETDYWGKIISYKRVAEITRKIQPFFLRRFKEDVLKDLPPKIYKNIVVDMSDEERSIYKKLAAGGHEATEDAVAMVAIIRCKQFCNYPPMIDESCKSTSKLDAFRDAVDEIVIRNGEKALIFSQYKEMLNVICPELDKMGIKYLRIDGDTPPIERASMQKVFNEDKSVDVMVGTSAMSAGLTLNGASVCFLFDQWWSNKIVQQAIDRCHRIGQKKVVSVISFTCRNSIEERIISVLKSKDSITVQTLGDDVDEIVVKNLGVRDIAKLL